ncbi:class F sortase [Streptomyces sp. LP05-1]|uniref:Class F sortase n=1 Tax=Streptomyces pyxinae TaxID=2970734 RepID=A0ABT2CLA4_9ACTN|nr:class F sortase [Streptomyces sp. LP05-1]MCS0638203.1 class F sortase [Streptomyces sp. LP05-1]
MTDPELRRRAWSLAAAACVGVWLVQQGVRAPEPPAPAAAQALTARPAPPAGTAVAPLPPSAPVRIRVPDIGVDAPVVGLGLNRDGSLGVPPAGHADAAGWFTDGTPPGARGTAIMAGHVDSAEGPAVFYRLGALTKGRRVEVTRRDGRTAVFTVHAVEVYQGRPFPDRQVYGPAPRPELRLITCGGGYDPAHGYRGNVVAYAHLTATRA